MSALQLICLAVVATLIGVSHSQVLGRFPLSPFSSVPLPVPVPLPLYADPFCYGADDLNALLLLAKAVEKSNEVNSNDIINKLLNALIYTTTGGSGGAGGSGGSGGSCTTKPTGGSTPSTPGKSPPLIDLGLLDGNGLLSLILAGQDVLNLDVGNKGGGAGGAVSNLLGGLL